MHRFFLFVACVTVLFLNANNAFAQFTTRQTSAVQSGNANAGSANGSLRFTRSSASGAKSSQGAVRSVKKQSSASYTKGGKANSVSKTTPSASMEDDDLDLPDFSITVPKETKGMSQAQKIILLEEFARKKQAEKEALAKEKAARKAEIARKIAEEEPAPGMVFDENGMERPIPKGEIWVYAAEFNQGEMRGRMHCSWKMVLQNRTNAKLDSLELGLSWPSYSVSMSFKDIAPNASKTEEMFMFSSNCPSLRAKPRLEPTKCVLGPMKDDTCNPYIVLK